VNILLTSTSYPPAIGGAQYHAHYIATRIARSNEVRVISLWDEVRTDWLLGTTVLAPPSEARYEIDGIRVRRLGFSAADKARMVPWLITYFLLRRNAIAGLSRVIQEKLVPEVEAADLIHNARIGREPIAFASYEWARRRSVPFVMTPYHHPWWRSRWHREYHRLYRMADGVIALTEAEKRALVGLGVAAEKITVTGTGPVLEAKADPAGFRSGHQLAAPFVLFLGQKYRYKNLRGLIEAARRVWPVHPEVAFVFIGPRTADSRRLFANLRDSRILELGSVSLQEKTDALAACTLLCQPSTQESFGAVFIEAWLMGKPVVGCDIPAVREVIADGVDGLVAQPTGESLGEAILYLLDNPALAREMASRGREKAQARFTWEALAQKTEEAYARALGR
jgi:glycosyltransferase involved in cell wall biosynthesis